MQSDGTTPGPKALDVGVCLPLVGLAIRNQAVGFLDVVNKQFQSQTYRESVNLLVYV